MEQLTNSLPNIEAQDFTPLMRDITAAMKNAEIATAFKDATNTRM